MPSHGWWQTRPQTPGKGCSSLKSSSASLYFPLFMSAINPCMLTWAGHAVLHGAVPLLLIPYAPGIAWAYCLNMAFLFERPLSYSLGSSIGQTLAQSPQLVHFERSTYRGFCLIFAVKFPGSPSSERSSVFVRSSMLRCRPTSTSLGEMTHIAQSLVGKVLSSWDIMPPIAADFSTR
jgi:hypothetical protein